MSYSIQRAAVIGAGIMGAGIAALLANVGVPVMLLDIVPPDAKDSTDRTARNKVAQTGLERAVKAKPASAFFTPKAARLVSIGNIEDDLAFLGEADWICEAVFERLEVKQDLYARIERVRRPGSIITSNTSGLPATMLLEGRNDDFRRHFLVTHFFNPVRFLKLLELVAGPETDPELMRYMGEFGANRLGKGVVYCKDRPNFIGNRIGTFGFMTTIHRMLNEGYKIEEVDAVLGPAMGRPKSAAFRTADIAGIDTLTHVADNLYENLPNDPQRELFRMPQFVSEMVKRGWVGDKMGQGFYKKTKDDAGRSEILVLDPATLEYRAQDSVHFSSLDSVKGNPDVAERVRTVIDATDRAGTLAWELTADMLLYSATVAEEIADDIVNIDRAMRWGFNWDAGPFETWDALGVEALAKRMTAEGRRLPPLVARVLGNGTGRFYMETPERQYFNFLSGTYQPVPMTGPHLSLSPLKKAGKVVKSNRSASLIDLGDGVLGLEFHSKMNTIDDDLTAMLKTGVEEAQQNWRALVIGNEAPDFSAGANVAQVLMAAKMRQWPLIDRALSTLQQAHQALKYSTVPTVVAPAGRALGGGCEIALHGQRVRAAAETYLGLVEVGVGLIPAGGGCKEMLVRWQSMAREGGPFAASRHAFEIIAVATVATSAFDAQQYGFLRTSDNVTLDRERLLADAKDDALALADARDRGEWRPVTPSTFHLPGAGGRLVLEQVADNLRLQGKASEHDAVIAGKLAYVLTGGDCSPLDELTEQRILDLEREAFLSLCGMPKTQERIEAILKTGKPLRN
ncbi:MAG: 3-hydroxyacyl-CoA dehydrogenase/enoyl-CoA hydratase family protein [Ktedonobacterales bacterium]|jgi:3-hydroxyacyl-CoA dehydrogenase|nr:MAG: 3-hydroxyacyl-CoA dehydrogenase/enoyl-CoA hydratase family protein [Ktedonobacterales bacterium]